MTALDFDRDFDVTAFVRDGNLTWAQVRPPDE